MSVRYAIPFARAVAVACRLIVLGLSLVVGPTLAATYNLPTSGIGSSPFDSCSFTSGTTYTCTSNVSIGSNDTINFTQDMTLKVEGIFKLNNNSNIYGHDHAVTIQADGNIQLGNSFVGSVNFVAGGDFTAGNTASITGNISAGGNITLGNSANVTGDVYTDGNLDVGSGTINGTCTYQTTNYTCSAVASLDHVRIEHSGAGITCMREPVTIKACQTSDCSTLYTSGSVSLTLSPSGAWYAAASGGTALNAVTFTGSTTLYFEKTTAGTVTLSASGISPSPPNGFNCHVGGVPNCSLAFADTGFVFAETANATTEATIPTQTAGAASGRYWLRAVKTADTNKGKACEAALAGATAVTLSYSCNDPATCYTTNPPACGSGNGYFCLTPHSADGATAQAAQPIASGGTSVTMNFDSNGNAPFTFNYMDVGKITLGAAKAAGGSLVNPLSGSSNPFVVKPGQLVISSVINGSDVPNPGTTTTAGAIFAAAGDDFTVKVQANTASGAVAPNFGNESAVPTITFVDSVGSSARIYSLVVPTQHAPSFGTLSVGTSSKDTGMAGAVKVIGNNWSEVGAITLKPHVGDYLGAGGVDGAESSTIGRFAPYRYEIGGTLASCASTFAYVGQPLTGTLTVTAQDKNGNTTTNYGKALSASSAATLATLAPGELTLGGLATGLEVDSASPLYSLVFASDEDFDTLRNGTARIAAAVPVKMTDAAAPLVPPITSGLKVTGSSDEITSIKNSPVDLLSPATTTFRAGRLRLSNAFGSERSGLSMDVQAQYWTGNSWIKAMEDTCTFPRLAAAGVALSNHSSTGGTPALAATNLGNNHILGFESNGGNWSLKLQRPDLVDNKRPTGSVSVAINLGSGPADQSCLSDHPNRTGLNMPWLRSRNGNCASTYDRDPSARATFGIYSPETGRTVHIREQF